MEIPLKSHDLNQQLVINPQQQQQLDGFTAVAMMNIWAHWGWFWDGSYHCFDRTFEKPGLVMTD